MFASEFSIQAILFGVSLLTIQSEYWTPLQKVQFGSLFLHQYTNYYTSGLKSEKEIHQLPIRIKCAYIYTIFSAIKSIDRYRQIEKKSGIDFYNEVGFLTIRGPDEGKKLIIKRVSFWTFPRIQNLTSKI